MNRCSCGSYALNRHNQTPESKLDKCDVCFWKSKWQSVQKEFDELELALFVEKQWFKMSERKPSTKGQRIILYKDSFDKMRIGVAEWLGAYWALPDYEQEHVLYWKRLPTYPNDRADKTSVKKD